MLRQAVMLSFYICSLLTAVIFVHGYPTAIERKNLPLNKGNMNKVKEIMTKMNKACIDPVPKLFPIDSIYPLPNGKYKPHCVMLHRCDKDAGCCIQDGEICAPAKTETIKIHIFAHELHQSTSASKIYEMTFENHTQCECKKLHEVPDQNMTPTVILQWLGKMFTQNITEYY